MSGVLTREIFDEFISQLEKQDEKARREMGERAREVAARGRHKSTLGQILDSAYIKHGPIIVSPKMAVAIKKQLEAAERRSDEA